MKAFAYIGLSMISMAGVLSGCSSPPKIDSYKLNEKQTTELAAVGSAKFGIRWEGNVRGVGKNGVIAVTDGVTTLTTRTGNRVFIVHNRKEFPPSDKTDFKGSDAELKNIGIKFLKASGAREEEIADVRILQHFTQVGEKIGDGKEVRMQEPQKSHRALLISRRIAGIDIISSRLLLNFNGFGRIAFMELNWPNIDRNVLERAMHLQKIAGNRYLAPQVPGAEIEAIQPVVLHSPAVGFYNDMTAAIRVIYRPTAPQIGKKPVRYIDERGEDVALPRSVDRPPEEPVKRVERKQ
jgi:hypothetical protein